MHWAIVHYHANIHVGLINLLFFAEIKMVKMRWLRPGPRWRSLQRSIDPLDELGEGNGRDKEGRE